MRGEDDRNEYEKAAGKEVLMIAMQRDEALVCGEAVLCVLCRGTRAILSFQPSPMA